jgi:hypothetical protein
MEFQFCVVVMSEFANKMLRAPNPSCFVYKEVNAQPYYNNLDCQKAFQRSTYYEFKAMEFLFRVVVTSECANKMLRALTPSCFVYKQVNAQPFYNDLDCQ